MSNIKYEVIDFVQEQLDKVIDATEAQFPTKDIAPELATTAAMLAARFAVAGGTSREDFLSAMAELFDGVEFPADISLMN